MRMTLFAPQCAHSDHGALPAAANALNEPRAARRSHLALPGIVEGSPSRRCELVGALAALGQEGVEIGPLLHMHFPTPDPAGALLQHGHAFVA